MSSTTDRQKKLEELQRRKAEMDAKRAMLAKNKTSDSGLGARIGSPSNDTTGAKGQSDSPAALNLAPQKTGPVIEISNFVGVFNMPAKQKAYMYDRSVEVTKEQIQLLLELQEEEKVPLYNVKEEEKDEDEYLEEKKKEKKTNQLPEEEVEKIYNKPNFKRFVRKGSQVIEQELSDTESLYDDILEQNDVGAEGEKTMVNFIFNFTSEAVKGYSATNLVWCRTNADLLLATYNTNDITEKYPSKILVWSLKNKLKPIYIMHSEKKITRAKFHPRNENIIYAATFTGNLLQFTCGQEIGPEVKNFNVGENGEFHATPIYVLEFYFKDEIEYLISISDDGKLCIWNTGFLFEPVVNKILEMPSKQNSSMIKLSSIHALNSTVVNQFSDEALLAVATHDATVIIYKIATLFGPAEELVVNYANTEHHGPISDLSFKSDPTKAYLQDLFLTASFDFDVQLIKANEYSSTVLKRFPLHLDYVTAVDWNPIHPALFASCDCNGKFLIYDLVMNANFYSHEGEASPASTLKWSPDGLRLAFGCLSGEIQIWQMRKKYLKCDEEKLNGLKYELQ